MAARFTGDVNCFATSDAAHPVPAHEVAIRCEFEEGLARDRHEFGGFIETALTTSAWKLGEPGTPARWSTGLQSVRRYALGGVTQLSLTQWGRGVGVSHGGNAWPVTHRRLLLDVGHGWVHITPHASLRVRSEERIRQLGWGLSHSHPPQHESHSCVNTTINFRQPKLPSGLRLGWNGVPPVRKVLTEAN